MKVVKETATPGGGGGRRRKEGGEMQGCVRKLKFR